MNSEKESKTISPRIIALALIITGLLPIPLALAASLIAFATSETPKEIVLVPYKGEGDSSSSFDSAPPRGTSGPARNPGKSPPRVAPAPSRDADNRSGNSSPGTAPNGGSSEEAKRTTLMARMPRDPRPEVADQPYATLEALDYAYDPVKHSLVIVGPWKNRIGVAPINKFSKEEGSRPFFIQGVELIELEGQPVQVEYKSFGGKDYYVAVQEAPSALVVVDARAMTTEFSIDLSSHDVEGVPRKLIAAPQEDSPWLYALISPFPKPKLLRMDLSQPDTLDVWNTNPSIRNFGVSQIAPDEVFVVSLNWRLSVPTQVPAAGETEFVEFEWATDGHRGAVTWHDPVEPIADPSGCFIAWRDVFSNDSKEILNSWQRLDVRGIIPGTSYVMGFVDERLFGYASLNGSDNVRNYQFPNGLFAYNRFRKANKLAVDLHVFFDPQENLVIIGSNYFAQTIPFEFFEEPDKPCLVYRQPPKTATVGEAYEYEIIVVKGQPAAELVAGPDGMAIDQTTVRWTPTAEDQGKTVNVEIDLRDGSVSKTAKWQIDVQ